MVTMRGGGPCLAPRRDTDRRATSSPFAPDNEQSEVQVPEPRVSASPPVAAGRYRSAVVLLAAAVFGSAYLMSLAGPTKAVERQTFAFRLARARPTGPGGLSRPGLGSKAWRPSLGTGTTKSLTTLTAPPSSTRSDGAARPRMAMGAPRATEPTAGPTSNVAAAPSLQTMATVDTDATCLASDDGVSQRGCTHQTSNTLDTLVATAQSHDV